ncbi:MAG: hypothetical protein LBQ43_01745 [Holosporales bacterium]|jgi:hypothetical protein|nr:hypothetical protein [Holosporales bacterium]
MLFKVSKIMFSFILVGPLCMGSSQTQKYKLQVKAALHEVLDENHLVPPADSPHLSASIQDVLGFTQEDLEKGGSARDRLERIITTTESTETNEQALRNLIESYNLERRKDTNDLMELLGTVIERINNVGTLVMAMFVYKMEYAELGDSEPLDFIPLITERQKAVEETELLKVKLPRKPYAAKNLVQKHQHHHGNNNSGSNDEEAPM